MEVDVSLEPRRLTWRMYRALVGTGMLCAAVIVTAYVLTGPIIKINKAKALEKAILKVLPNTESRQAFGLKGNTTIVKVLSDSDITPQLFAGYDKKKRLIGLAIKAQGMGYQDTISLIYGYAPQTENIIGINILDSRETPGLGDKIRNDPKFLANFKQLDVTLNAGQIKMKNPIDVVKKGKKIHPWQIDSITGATISSKAIAKILNKSMTQWAAKIQQNKETFEIGGETTDGN